MRGIIRLGLMSPIIPGCQWPLSSDQNLPLIPETKSRVVREHQQQSRDESTEETWRTSVGGALDALPNPSLQCPSVYHKRRFSKRPYNFTMLLCEVLCFTLELVEETHVVVVVAARETTVVLVSRLSQPELSPSHLALYACQAPTVSLSRHALCSERCTRCSQNDAACSSIRGNYHKKPTRRCTASGDERT